MTGVQTCALPISLKRVLEAAPERIYIDSDAIYRCLLNLLTNAADAVPAEGGRVVLAMHAATSGVLEISVCDNGGGIPEAQREKVFDPFYSTKGSRGTGLGLAVTRKIVHEHGGAITITTSEWGGACFVLHLPCVPGTEAIREPSCTHERDEKA